MTKGKGELEKVGPPIYQRPAFEEGGGTCLAPRPSDMIGESIVMGGEGGGMT